VFCFGHAAGWAAGGGGALCVIPIGHKVLQAYIKIGYP